MVNLTIGTNTERKNVIVDVNTTLAQALSDNGVSTQGTALYLNSKMLAGCDVEATLNQLGVEDGSRAMLIAVVKSENAFKVTYTDNVLTVVTDITKETVEKGISNLKAKDEKGNDAYAVTVDKNGSGYITDFGIACNTFVDGKLTLTKVLPMDTKIEDVHRQFGELILAAKKFTAQIASEASAKEAEIAGLFQ